MRGILVSTLAMALLLGVGCGRSGQPAKRYDLERVVYISLDPTSLLSLQDALQKKGYGQVTVSDFRAKYNRQEDVDFGPDGRGAAIIAWTDEKLVPGGTTFQPTCVLDCFTETLGDDSSAGVIFDPGLPGSLAVSDRAINAAFPDLADYVALGQDDADSP